MGNTPLINSRLCISLNCESLRVNASVAGTICNMALWVNVAAFRATIEKRNSFYRNVKIRNSKVIQKCRANVEPRNVEVSLSSFFLSRSFTGEGTVTPLGRYPSYVCLFGDC